MILHFNSTTLDVKISDESYRYQQIMGEHSLTLIFSLPTYVEIPVGAFCSFQGETYTLTKPQNLKKIYSREFEYTLVMDAPQIQLAKYKFKDTNTGKLKFWLTAKPQEHLQMIVDNMNQRDSGWSAGDYVDAAEKLVTFNHNNCSEALQMVATAYNTEFEIVGKTIHIRRVEHNKDNPLPLSYGKGNGLKTGVTRTNYDSSKAVEILYTQGGERNIDPSKYGATELLLPKSQSLTYEGRNYISDSEGFYIKRADRALQTHEEDSLDCSYIYPSRIGAVTTAVTVDADKNFYDFVDASLNFDFTQYVIAGQTMTVIFQTGMLSGRELEVKYVHAPILDSHGAVLKLGKRFELVPQEIDGVTMPDATFKPAVGDQYVVFGMVMPDEYVCDNTNKAGASWDMYREAAKYLYENEDPRFSFVGEMDGIYAKANWTNIGAKIVLGGFILFSDEQFQITGVPIRIMGIKQFINNPYKPQIELSNVTAGQTVSSMLRKVENNEVYTQAVNSETVGFTKRRFRDAKETIDLLKKAQFHFSDSINPITVETMSLLVGDVSLQFRFVESMLSQDTINHNIIWDNEEKKLKVDAGWLQHMTLGIGSITKSHKPEEYKYWNLAYYESAMLEDQMVDGALTSLPYYLYAHCTGDGVLVTTGAFILSTGSMASSENDNYFLVGILNSEFEDDRSFVTLYGYTEVLPGRITADRVVSTDGLNFMDFVKKSFRVGSTSNYLEYNRDIWDTGLQKFVGDGKLRLKGMLVQNAGGVEDALGVFRGDYSAGNTYYYADEVYYAGSTYRYINATQGSSNPTNTTYWKIKASKGEDGYTPVKGTDYFDGAKGDPGASVQGDPGAPGPGSEFIYKLTMTSTGPSTPATNQTDGLAPTGWTNNPSGVSQSYPFEWVCKRTKSAGTWSAFSTPAVWAKYAADGSDGAQGAALIFVGEYSASNSYVGTPGHQTIVNYGGSSYLTKTTAGSISGVVPTNTTYWEAFGAQFESIATQILFASLGYVDNLGVRYLNTGGSAQRVTIDGSTGTLTFYNASNVAVMTLGSGILTAIGAYLKNANFEGGSASNNSAIRINNGMVVMTETTTGEVVSALETVAISAAGIDLYQMIGGAGKHITIHSLAGTISIQGTSIIISNASGVEKARMDLDGIVIAGAASADSVGANSMSTKYITLPRLNATQVAAVPNGSIYIDTNGTHCAKDGSGNPHTLW